jgi:hypothetical protein
MTDVVITGTRSTPVDLSGGDTLTVQSASTLGSSTSYAARFTAPTSGALIRNNGLIVDPVAGAAAIELDAGAAFDATIINSGGNGIFANNGKGVVLVGSVSSGRLVIDNEAQVYGLQAFDLSAAQGSFTTTFTNTNTVNAQGGDAVQIGGVVDLTNHSVMVSATADVLHFLANATATVTNLQVTSEALFHGSTHAIEGAAGSDITIHNGDSSHTLSNIDSVSGAAIYSLGSVTLVNYGGIISTNGYAVQVAGRVNIENFGAIDGSIAGGLPAIRAGGGTIINHQGAFLNGVVIDDGSGGNAPFALHLVNDGNLAGGVTIVGARDNTVDNSGFIPQLQFGSGNDTLIIRNGSIITSASGGVGIDTLDYSAYTTAPVVVTLDAWVPGAGTATGFENIAGSALADTLTGSTADNVLIGNGGNDVLDGGAGNDTAVYSGAWIDYDIAGGATLTITDRRGGSPDGADTVSNVENFRFANGTFTAAQIINHAPTDIALALTVLNAHAPNGTVVGTLSASDPDTPLGDTASFTLLDDAGGRLALSGNALVVADGSRIASGSDLSVSVKVTDAHGLSFNEMLIIKVAPVSQGSPAADVIAAPSGSSAIDGGAGIDTVTFDFKLTDATISYAGNHIIIDGPSSHTVLSGFEIYQFTDGTVNDADGNPLVDDLFYYSRYHDVWNAHADADTHYNTVGWMEKRDPNAFFSTSFYDALYPDAKGSNPLIAFDQGGWRQGREPAPNFDTAKYLVANPDVAAAGLDPLAHFLSTGAGEGRQPFTLDHLVAANGFDYVYYLQHNPDVAAAGIDPLLHYETAGWREGRNPNAWFDDAGYLAHYADVAAAGVNPLDHYHTIGWQEGRDPSTAFDTTDYLHANPDAASAHIDPLLHYLQHGIAEGRAAFNDGVWG